MNILNNKLIKSIVLLILCSIILAKTNSAIAGMNALSDNLVLTNSIWKDSYEWSTGEVDYHSELRFQETGILSVAVVAYDTASNNSTVVLTSIVGNWSLVESGLLKVNLAFGIDEDDQMIDGLHNVSVSSDGTTLKIVSWRLPENDMQRQRSIKILEAYEL